MPNRCPDARDCNAPHGPVNEIPLTRRTDPSTKFRAALGRRAGATRAKRDGDDESPPAPVGQVVHQVREPSPAHALEPLPVLPPPHERPAPDLQFADLLPARVDPQRQCRLHLRQLKVRELRVDLVLPPRLRALGHSRIIAMFGHGCTQPSMTRRVRASQYRVNMESAAPVGTRVYCSCRSIPSVGDASPSEHISESRCRLAIRTGGTCRWRLPRFPKDGL